MSPVERLYDQLEAHRARLGVGVLVVVRCGDFVDCFGADAYTLSHALGIPIVSIGRGADAVAVCGFARADEAAQVHAVRCAGFRIAVVDGVAGVDTGNAVGVPAPIAAPAA